MSRPSRIGLRAAWRNLRSETGWTWKQFVAAIRAAESQESSADQPKSSEESNEQSV